MLDGIGWVMYLWPPLATYVFPAIAIVAGLAELPLQIWLIAFGVNPQRWREQARRSLSRSGLAPGPDLTATSAAAG